MGLLLSVLVVCVGVVELLACYRDVMRSPAIHNHNQDGHQLARIAQWYLRELNRERLRLLAALGQEDDRPDLTDAATNGHYEKSKELNNNHHAKSIYSISEFPDLQIRKASLEESLCKEDIVHHMSGDVSSLIIVSRHHTDDDSLTNRHVNREGSPYPTYDLIAPRNSISMDSSVSLLEIDEVDIDRKSTSPITQKIDMILQESNFDSKEFWPIKNVAGQKKRKETSPPPPGETNCSEQRQLEKFTIVDNNVGDSVGDEDDSVPDFDTSVLQRIDGVSSKPRTPSEERKLKLKKKRNSKSFKEPASPPPLDSDSSIISDVLDRGGPVEDSPSPSSSKSAQEPFWVNRS